MLARRVMVDVDGEYAVQAFDAGTLEVGAFHYENGVVMAVDHADVLYLVGTRQAAISRRHVAGCGLRQMRPVTDRVKV